jgi:hypothetical protein
MFTSLNNFDQYEAEIEYRRNRARKAIGPKRRSRVPFVRKPAQATRTAD